MESALERKLLELFANLYALYLKTQNCHWNVKGPLFYAVHKMTEEHYEKMADEIDELAENLKQYDIHVPGNLAFLNETATIKSVLEEATAEQYVNDLIESHKLFQRDLNKLLNERQLEGHHGLIDALTVILKEHRHMMWFLHSSL